MTSLILSFLALVSIPVLIVLAVVGIRTFYFKQSFPKRQALFFHLAMNVGITLAITLVISGIFSFTGFFESQFFRPSQRIFSDFDDMQIPYEECTFKSTDGTELHGYFIPAMMTVASDSKAQAKRVGTVIHFHGSDRNISFTAKNSAWLANHGFNVFAFDYRGYGKSQGEPSREKLIEDGVSAIQFVGQHEQVDPKKIVLWGQSMGGQLAINAAVRSQKTDLSAVIAEATYSSFSHHVKDKMANMGPLWLMQWSAWLLTSDQHSAIDSVQKLSAPLLLVHGSADRVVMPYQSEWLLEKATEPKKIWRAKGGGHLKVFNADANQKLLIDYLNEAFE